MTVPLNSLLSPRMVICAGSEVAPLAGACGTTAFSCSKCLFSADTGHSVRPRESGDPAPEAAALDSRLRGNERREVSFLSKLLQKLRDIDLFAQHPRLHGKIDKFLELL